MLCHSNRVMSELYRNIKLVQTLLTYQQLRTLVLITVILTYLAFGYNIFK